ncbi:MAG: cytochrome c biogenesis protein CcdA [Luteibaculaceae bacterium]
MRIFSSFLALVFLFIASFLEAQIHDPIKWSFKVEQTSDENFTLVAKATLEKGWYLYGQFLENDNGPVATNFTYFPGNRYALNGKTKEEGTKEKFDDIFQMQVSYFEKVAVFKQSITAKPGPSFKIKGEVEFMVCDVTMCLPPDIVEFEFTIPEVKPAAPKVMAQNEEADATATQEELGFFEPVSWSFAIKSAQEKVLVFEATATIEEEWYIYALTLPSNEGPIPTSFTFTENPAISLVGILAEPTPLNKYDANFLMDINYHKKQVTFTQSFKVERKDAKPLNFSGALEFMTCNDVTCLPPELVEFDLPIPDDLISNSEQSEFTEFSADDERSYWTIFFLSFLGGFAALLTPCVFPMIPMTVSFFTKQSKTKAKGISNAILYGAAIIVLYTGLGMAITIAFGSDTLNAISTNEWVNLVFFLLLVVFAISFLGAFEITLPSKWVNAADKGADKGGLIGIFFMALTLSVVSFSCTGPIIGTLLVQAAEQGGVAPAIGMLGFSSALALPFGFFAAFPGYLNSLPKSGGWLNSVKVTLGLLELALAMKFLSNADLVLQLGIITREVFLVSWIAIFGVLTVYLFGGIRFPHDSKLEKISVTRFFFALFTLMFTIYLIPGLWGAPLKIISGFPPPMHYAESPNGFHSQNNIGLMAPAANAEGSNDALAKASSSCPLGLKCFKDYDEGMAYALEAKKPVLLDFTGHACVNCRKMEEQVWSDSRVFSLINDDFVLISLYVDDRKPLPESEQVEVEVNGKKRTLRTVGNKWSYFQAVNFKSNAQPQYIILDNAGNKLLPSYAYNPNIEKYIRWLEAGLEAYSETLP